MTPRRAEVLATAALVGVCAVWGSTFVVVKDAIERKQKRLPVAPVVAGGRMYILADNATLIANSRLVIAPPACLASTTACNVTITPVLGQVGTANVTVTITDGARRTASTKFAVTVTKPRPPTVSVTAGGSRRS